MTWNSWPSISIATPRRRSLVEITEYLLEPELFGRRAQDFGAALGKQDQILDPHAAHTAQVDARLDAEHHARLQDVFAPGSSDPGWLMDLEPDPVSESMN